MLVFFFFKQKTAYEIGVRLVGSEMCIRDRYLAGFAYSMCGMWSALLEENGSAVVPVDAAQVTLRRGSQRATFAVVTTLSRVHPSDVTEPPAGNALLIVPALSEAAAQRAR